MEIKKLSSFFLFFLLLVLLISCNSNTENDVNKENAYNGVTTIIKDNGVMFIDTVNFNNIKYERQAISDYDLNYNIVRFINNEDTIEFEKDALFVRDSVYDINNDNEDDLNITYQATKGFITYSYLFNVEINKLSIIPDTLRYSLIDD
jgi:uncharacterized protein YcfL